MAFTDRDQVRYWLNPVHWLARKARLYAQSGSQFSPFALTDNLAQILAEHAYANAKALQPADQRKPTMHDAFVEVSLLTDTAIETIVGRKESGDTPKDPDRWLVAAVISCGYSPKKPLARAS